MIKFLTLVVLLISLQFEKISFITLIPIVGAVVLGWESADVLATAEISGKNLVTSNTLTSILQSKGTDVSFTFPDDKFQKWEKNSLYAF